MKCFRVTVGILFLTLTAWTGAFGQTSTVSGRISTAQSGNLAGADVTLRVLPPPGAPVMPKMPNMPNMAGQERTAQRGAHGSFPLSALAPCQYVLQVDSYGCERSSKEISLPNQPVTVAVTLQPLELAGAEPPPAATPSSANAATVVD